MTHRNGISVTWNREPPRLVIAQKPRASVEFVAALATLATMFFFGLLVAIGWVR